MTKIRKAVIPAAGWGTRFLPFSKAIPKEMLPLVDKPIIQQVVEEAVSAGIKDIIIVITSEKQAIRDHFSQSLALEKYLAKAGKTELLKMVKSIGRLTNFTFVNQSGPYGNGTPVLQAKKYIGNEPFAMLWGDDFIFAQPTRLQQMIEIYNKYQGPVVNAVPLKEEIDAERYGMAKVEHLKNNIYKIIEFVEKPGYKNRPSNLIIPGGSILTPDIFPALESLKPGKGGEIWLIDAIHKIKENRAIYACEIKNGKFYDTGNKLEYLKTVIDFGLKHPETKKGLKKYLKEMKI